MGLSLDSESMTRLLGPQLDGSLLRWSCRPREESAVCQTVNSVLCLGVTSDGAQFDSDSLATNIWCGMMYAKSPEGDPDTGWITINSPNSEWHTITHNIIAAAVMLYHYYTRFLSSTFVTDVGGHRWQLRMSSFKPKLYRSQDGCCICRAKSSR